MPYAEGQYVSWETRDGVQTVQLTVVTAHRIAYRCADDYVDAVEATVFGSLAEKITDWRPATAQEITAFRARFRPAPENWN
ncbi:hypothetical protein ACFU96_44275 [Streptomyces sp. NPDC057620]|uniref:hypothetical protein n=1 Tax=Streptomyces sp. NPDC057620 TaxID=3346185 RepID=UPI0036C90E7F